MPSPHIKPQLDLLETILGLGFKELAQELCGSQMNKGNVTAESLLRDCSRGKNSLKNQPLHLRTIVEKLGLRPSCVLGNNCPLLEALPLNPFTPLWFLAWTFTGLHPNRYQASAKPVASDRLTLARRVDLANKLHFGFLEECDPHRIKFATYEEFEEGDFTAKSADWWRGLGLSRTETLWAHRREIAEGLFQSFSLTIPPLPPSRWPFEVWDLERTYSLSDTVQFLG